MPSQITGAPRVGLEPNAANSEGWEIEPGK